MENSLPTTPAVIPGVDGLGAGAALAAVVLVVGLVAAGLAVVGLVHLVRRVASGSVTRRTGLEVAGLLLPAMVFAGVYLYQVYREYAARKDIVWDVRAGPEIPDELGTDGTVGGFSGRLELRLPGKHTVEFEEAEVTYWIDDDGRLAELSASAYMPRARSWQRYEQWTETLSLETRVDHSDEHGEQTDHLPSRMQGAKVAEGRIDGISVEIGNYHYTDEKRRIHATFEW